MATLGPGDAIDDGSGVNKLIIGTADVDTIDTSTDNSQDWIINGDAGGDTIITGDGDTGTATGGVTVNAGDGNDNITGGAGDDNLRGEGDADTINGGDGGDNIDGGAGDDILNGEGGHDNIDGGLGNDTIDGGDGSDVIIGSAGTDSVTGGTNFADPGRGGFDGDVFQYNNDIEILQSITDNGAGNFTIVTDLGTTTIQSGIEYLWFNTSPFISIDLNDANNKYGQATDDTLNGDLGNGNVILAGAGADTIDTGNGDNRVYAGSGDDGITTGTGNDEVDGGSGTDTVTVGYATTDVTSYTNDGTTITLVTATNTDVIRNVEVFNFTDSSNVALANMNSTFASLQGPDVDGTVGDDNPLDGTSSGENINGLAGNDVINGLAGNDTITPGAGDDTVDGGADNDTVVLEIAKADVTGYSETGGVVTITSVAGGTDTISNVENFEFTDGTVTAGNLATEFASVNTADQSFTATNADDTFTGALGDDTVTFGVAKADVTGYSESGGVVTITTSTGGTDTITNVENFVFTDGTVLAADLATEFASVSTADQSFTATNADDTFTGALGDDTVTFGVAKADVTGYSESGGVVTITTSTGGTDTITNVENFVFTDGTVLAADLATEFASVNTADQSFTATNADDTFTGALGDDTVTFGVAKADVTGYSESGGVVTITSVAGGTDTITNVENFVFTDGTVLAADLATEFVSVASVDQTFTSTSGDDAFTGGNGTDKTVFGFAAADLTALSIAGSVLTVVGTEGTDTLTSIETLEFSDQTIAVSDLLLGTTSGETVTGTANADIIAAGTGTDIINAGAGDDLIIGAEIGETIDGGAGTDTVKFGFASSTITSAVRKLNGSVEITTADGTTTLSNVENVVFASEATAAIGDIVTSLNAGKPVFTVPDGNGGTIEATPEVYSGPVDYLEYQLLGDALGNVVTGSSSNDFFNLLDGDDAANGGDGDDVLDGGLGSNFLTGGNGGDVFFIDGRGASGGAITWSTITDFTAGDSVNIWGWVDGTSRVFSQDASNGATDFEGITIHYDLDNNGSLDTSITFTGLTAADLPTPTSADTAGGVLIFTA